MSNLVCFLDKIRLNFIYYLKKKLIFQIVIQDLPSILKFGNKFYYKLIKSLFIFYIFYCFLKF